MQHTHQPPLLHRVMYPGREGKPALSELTPERRRQTFHSSGGIRDTLFSESACGVDNPYTYPPCDREFPYRAVAVVLLALSCCLVVLLGAFVLTW